MKKKKIIIILSSIMAVLVITASVIFIPIIKRNINNKKMALIVQDYYNSKVVSFEDENKRYKEGEVDIVFLGDSLTDGYPVDTYYPQYKVLNRGIGGDTTFGLEQRLEVSAFCLKPKVVTMLIGGNNLDTMFDNYENILQSFKVNIPDTKIILLSLTAMGQSFKEKNAKATLNNVIIKKLADKYSYTFVDLFTPLYNIETGEIYEKYTVEGIHFTNDGYDLITSILTSYFEELLEY